MRRTKIIATVGPATNDREMLALLIEAGMDICRINCSHADHSTIERVVKDVRALARAAGKSVGILLDLCGPKIRTGVVNGDTPVELLEGQTFVLTNREVDGDNKTVSTNYEMLPREVRPGDAILLDDGLLQLKVLKTTDTDVVCQVVSGGLLKSHKGINLPGVRLSIPAITDKDRADLLFGLDQNIDFVALSFVRDPADVEQLRRLIGDHYPPVSIIAKLEKPEALVHLDAILAAADAVMIARGDLGVELPPEKVPPIQKLITRKANDAAKPVITATQMLESMIENPRPTRAEASDVANAIFDGTDAIMLSAESASGKHPIESVQMMARIAEAAESSLDYGEMRRHDTRATAHAIAHAACEMAVDMKAKAIAAFTKTGTSARMISQLRPPTPIVALTQYDHVYRKLALYWGVTPLMLTEVSDTESTLAFVEKTMLKHGHINPGETMIVTGGMPLVARGPANFVKLSILPAETSCQASEIKGI